MSEETFGKGHTPADLDLSPKVAAAMRADLPRVAEQVVAAIRAEVPSYADPFKGEMGRNIENAVALALGGFLGIASGQNEEATEKLYRRVADAAYALGRGEARSGRTMDALLSAYRVGARVAWRDLAGSAVQAGLEAATRGEVRRARLRLHRRALRHQRRRSRRRAGHQRPGAPALPRTAHPEPAAWRLRRRPRGGRRPGGVGAAPHAHRGDPARRPGPAASSSTSTGAPSSRPSSCPGSRSARS